eukprot:TRINITY_DN2970_c0_g1_i2.p1 TRINITY_DN2970_c0_g1~~TRINITY_DN2970_c0_g1_i2.p1  ORF type:complete len:455 (+),score=101.12 TRINITY_DN2970_c0_g1_i2:191-1366(+)
MDEVEFQTMLAGEISEKIEELESKHGDQPPLPGAAGEIMPLPPPPAALGLPALQSSGPVQGMPALPSFPGVPAHGVGLGVPPGLAGTLPPGLTGLLPPGLAAFGKMPPMPGAPLGIRPPLIPGMMPPLIPGMMPMMAQPANFTQQQAQEYDNVKARDTALEPEVIELVHYFKISERHGRMLNEQLKKRNNTYEEDIAAMYEILKGAKNPADLLMVSIRWMERGVFRGTLTPDPAVEKAAKMYKLDAPSACKLAEVLESREDPEGDLRKISEHLAASNKPSSLVMQMLRTLKEGKPIPQCSRAPAIGSYLHKKETQSRQKKSRSGDRPQRARSCSRSRGGRGGRSRERGGRSRSRGRGGRSRSRPRGGRSRSRGRGGRDRRGDADDRREGGE